MFRRGGVVGDGKVEQQMSSTINNLAILCEIILPKEFLTYNEKAIRRELSAYLDKKEIDDGLAYLQQNPNDLLAIDSQTYATSVDHASLGDTTK